jgi:Transposase Tn5 dimerisation domain
MIARARRSRSCLSGSATEVWCRTCSCFIGLLPPFIVLEEPEHGETGLSPHLPLPLFHPRLDHQVYRFMGCDCHIETFHKILQSGCRVEESRLRTAERLVNLLAIFCILSWRVFWVTMLRRATPHLQASVVFTPSALWLLQSLQTRNAVGRASLDCCILQIAKLGGYLARATDSPPGPLVIWRGLTRLTDIQLGFSLGEKSCG